MPTWPSDLTGDPEAKSITDADDDRVIAFNPDIGRELTRSRFTAHTKTSRLSYPPMTATERAAWLTFKRNEIAHGALSFTMTDPQEGDTGTFLLKRFSFAHAGGDGYILSATFRRLS